jgi:predicted nucleic acid-binding protein
VTLILDSHGVTGLAGDRTRLAELRSRGEWPPLVPTVVLAEALSGDHRRDYHENRLLRTCDIQAVDEALAREAAALRAEVQTRRTPSVVDAIVVALADQAGGGIVLSSDPDDLRVLARRTRNPVRIESI